MQVAIKQKTGTDNVIRSLLTRVDVDGGLIQSHSKAVYYYAALFAEKMNCLSNLERYYLRWGALLHDIGKFDVGSALLQKPTTLNDSERRQMQMHPVWGFEKAQQDNIPHEVAEIILYHHERVDGKGYPFGRSGSEIPLLARICSVIDAFDAMTSNRPYRDKKDIDDAFKQLEEHRGSQFDAQIVNQFIGFKARIEQEYCFSADYLGS